MIIEIVILINFASFPTKENVNLLQDNLQYVPQKLGESLKDDWYIIYSIIS